MVEFVGKDQRLAAKYDEGVRTLRARRFGRSRRKRSYGGDVAVGRIQPRIGDGAGRLLAETLKPQVFLTFTFPQGFQDGARRYVVSAFVRELLPAGWYVIGYERSAVGLHAHVAAHGVVSYASVTELWAYTVGSRSVPPEVEAVTERPGESYEESQRRVCSYVCKSMDQEPLEFGAAMRAAGFKSGERLAS